MASLRITVVPLDGSTTENSNRYPELFYGVFSRNMVHLVFITLASAVCLL